MNTSRAIELLKIEKECVLRNVHHVCDHLCGTCDLAQSDYDLIEMYDYVIKQMGGSSTSNRQEPRAHGCYYYTINNKMPYCTHECDGCTWYM